MNAVELLPQGTKPQRPTAIAYEWPITLGASDTMHTDLSWSLAELGAPASTAKDLLRVVAAAYIADRTNSRPAQALQRDLHLSVHLDEPQAWTPAALNHTVDLLHWLTGDIWTLEVLAAQPSARSGRARSDGGSCAGSEPAVGRPRFTVRGAASPRPG